MTQTKYLVAMDGAVPRHIFAESEEAAIMQFIGDDEYLDDWEGKEFSVQSPTDDYSLSFFMGIMYQNPQRVL